FQDVEAVTRWRRYDAMIGVSEGNQDRAVRGRHAAAGDLELARTRRVPEAATEARIGHRVHVELPLPRPLRGDVVRQLVIEPGAPLWYRRALPQVVHVPADRAAVGGGHRGAERVLDADRVRGR